MGGAYGYKHVRNTGVDEAAAKYSAAGLSGQVDPAALQEIIARVVEVARPDRIILFGSAARGEMGSQSDIDLLVIKSGITNRRRLAQKIYRRLIGIDRAVDIVVVAPEDIDRLGQRVGSVVRPALLDGREVYAA